MSVAAQMQDDEAPVATEVVVDAESPPDGVEAVVPDDGTDTYLFGAIDLSAISLFLWEENGWAILLLLMIAYWARGMIPPHVLEMSYNINTTLIDQLDKRADMTITPIDNYAVDALRQTNEQVFGKVPDEPIDVPPDTPAEGIPAPDTGEDKPLDPLAPATP